MSHQPTHPIPTSILVVGVNGAPHELKIITCATLLTEFGTLSALRVTGNGKVSHQIAATCRFDAAYKEYGNPAHKGAFYRMSVRGNTLIMDLLDEEAAKEDPGEVCLLNDTYSSFDAMWANYEMMIASYMSANKVWLKARES